MTQYYSILYMYMYMYVQLLRQSKARQLRLRTTTVFSEEKKGAAWGGIQTRGILRARQTLYQLSHWGSSAGQARSLKVHVHVMSTVSGQESQVVIKNKRFSLLVLTLCRTKQTMHSQDDSVHLLVLFTNIACPQIFNPEPFTTMCTCM